METEDFEEDEANTGKAEDESPRANDEDMDAKEDEEEEQMADEQSEGMEGNEKQDEGESPKVGGYQVLVKLRRPFSGAPYRKGNPCIDFPMVTMASGIARGRVGAYARRDDDGVPQDGGHTVKTTYPLNSIT